jgi:hypothetical protein
MDSSEDSTDLQIAMFLYYIGSIGHMSFLDKVKFWKKKDDFSDLDLGKDFDLGSDDLGKSPIDSSKSFSDSFNDQDNQPIQQEQSQYSAPSAPESFSQISDARPPDIQSVPSYQPPQTSQDLQLVSAKLDAIKAYLDTINQRLANLENMARGHDEKRW